MANPKNMAVPPAKLIGRLWLVCLSQRLKVFNSGVVAGMTLERDMSLGLSKIISHAVFEVAGHPRRTSMLSY